MTNPPNVMSAGTWVLAVIVLLAILVPAVVIGMKLWLARPRWRTVHLPGLVFKLSGGVTDAVVAEALLLALEELRQVWPSAPSPSDLRIQVMPEESWLNSANVRVGGEQDGNILRVGPSLTALCHELAHLLEAKLDKVRDDAHAGWTAKAIWTADEKYRATLREVIK